jgi:hypothetical protein
MKDYQSEVNMTWRHQQQEQQKNKDNLFAHIVIRSEIRNALASLTRGGQTYDDVLSMLIRSYKDRRNDD